MEIADACYVSRACFGYGPDTPEAPEEFVAGFRAERHPMLWTASGGDADTPMVYRCPNVADDNRVKISDLRCAESTVIVPAFLLR